MLKINGKFVSGSNSYEELNNIIFEWFGSNGYVEVLGGTNYCELGWECLIDEMEGRAMDGGESKMLIEYEGQVFELELV